VSFRTRWPVDPARRLAEEVTAVIPTIDVTSAVVPAATTVAPVADTRWLPSQCAPAGLLAAAAGVLVNGVSVEGLAGDGRDAMRHGMLLPGSGCKQLAPRTRAFSRYAMGPDAWRTPV
jgi:hypothetical protein